MVWIILFGSNLFPGLPIFGISADSHRTRTFEILAKASLGGLTGVGRLTTSRITSGTHILTFLKPLFYYLFFLL